MYILIAEDESDIRELLRAGLEKLGHKVLEAENGNRALEMIKDNSLKLLITDIRMPGGDGIFLLKEIQKSKGPRFPIVVMTGFSDASVDELKSLGAEKVLLKPFRFKEFLAQIADYLK